MGFFKNDLKSNLKGYRSPCVGFLGLILSLPGVGPGGRGRCIPQGQGDVWQEKAWGRGGQTKKPSLTFSNHFSTIFLILNTPASKNALHSQIFNKKYARKSQVLILHSTILFYYIGPFVALNREMNCSSFNFNESIKLEFPSTFFVLFFVAEYTVLFTDILSFLMSKFSNNEM